MPLLSFSQKDKKDYDTLYLKQFKQNFYPYTFINLSEYYLSVYEYENGDYSYYYPNSKGSIGLGFDYKWATLAYSFSIIEKEHKKDKNFNFSYGISRRKFRLAFLYQNYKGFFQSNVINNDSLAMQDTIELYRPNLINKNLKLSFFYIFNNKKVSYRSSFLYFEKQLKSAGSLTIGSNIYYTKIEDSESLLYSQQNPNNTNQELFTKVNNLNVGVNIGYFYTFVFLKNMHISAYIATNLYNQINLGHTIRNPAKSNTRLGWGIDYRTIVGYDNDKFFSGITLSGSVFSRRYNKNSLDNNFSMIEVYFGKRFDLSFKKK